MKSAIKILVFICLIVFSGSVFAQTKSEKLKKEQVKIEKRIKNTKSLLDKTKNKAQSSLQELELVEAQISTRETLVKNFDEQVRAAEFEMIGKANDIKHIQERQKNLKKQYRQMLLHAFKNRNKLGKLMFVFSAHSYTEALHRNNYLEKMKEIEKTQFQLLRKNQEIVQGEYVQISSEKTTKELALNEKIKEKELIEQDKQLKEELYQKLKKEEETLRSNLAKDEKEKQVLKTKINAAIQDELKKSSSSSKKTKSKTKKKDSSKETKKTAATKDKKETASTPKKSEEVVYVETPESSSLGSNFSGNKGKLPFPVASGTITEKFGTNPHPTIKNVFTNNNGVDISTAKNATVRSVFEGEVSSVLTIPGAGKVIIIKHGNYRTVYSNLRECYVSVGTKVSTKQSIGSLLTNESGSVSIAHFEIHLVSGGNIQCLNPSLWLSR
jgi:septal ring factor EnvC (AmiA/AmiB activator)